MGLAEVTDMELIDIKSQLCLSVYVHVCVCPVVVSLVSSRKRINMHAERITHVTSLHVVGIQLGRV